jgi:hypothetical protein
MIVIVNQVTELFSAKSHGVYHYGALFNSLLNIQIIPHKPRYVHGQQGLARYLSEFRQ